MKVTVKYSYNTPFEPPEPVAVALCCRCKGDIYDGETCGVSPEGFVCSDCVDDMWRELTLTEKIERLGMEPTRIERIKPRKYL